MKIAIHGSPRVALTLLLAAIVLTGISAFAQIQVDTIVHHDLYTFGLEFSREWAIPYWTFDALVLAFQGVAMLTATASAVLMAIQWRTQRRTSSGVTQVLHVICIATIALSLLFFLQLDALVHGDLYSFGLQMSNQWVMPYWLYSRTLLSLGGISIVAATASLALNFLGFRKTRIDTTRLIAGAMLGGGLILLALSIVYNLSILAFIGLGLTFWGAILNYIQSEEYVKKPLLDRISAQTFTTLTLFLQELDYQGTAVYLPPKYFRNPETSKAYISRHRNGPLPDPDYIEQHEDQLFTTNAEGILFTPPGAEIARLFEESLGTSFTKIDLQYLTQKLPKIIEEDLEIARSVEMKTQNRRIRVTMEHVLLPAFSSATSRLQATIHLGSHLTGAVACALAKTTGRPIILHRQLAENEGKTLEVEYRILTEESGE
jgi:hypothetical protein